MENYNFMIVTMTLEHALYVSQHMRDNDYCEIMAHRWNDDVIDFAKETVRYPGVKVCALDLSGTPVAIGGIALHTPGVGVAWMIGTNDLSKVALSLTRFCKQHASQVLKSDLNRLQALSAVFHVDAHKWLRAIGFEIESTLEQSGKHGEDFYLFAQTNNNTNRSH